MSKAYFQSIEKKVKDLQKVWVELYNRNDTLVSDNTLTMRTVIALKNRGILANINQDRSKSIFDLMDREQILLKDRMDDDIIFAQA